LGSKGQFDTGSGIAVAGSRVAVEAGSAVVVLVAFVVAGAAAVVAGGRRLASTVASLVAVASVTGTAVSLIWQAANISKDTHNTIRTLRRKRIFITPFDDHPGLSVARISRLPD
jgi:hypothetical protein